MKILATVFLLVGVSYSMRHHKEFCRSDIENLENYAEESIFDVIDKGDRKKAKELLFSQKDLEKEYCRGCVVHKFTPFTYALWREKFDIAEDIYNVAGKVIDIADKASIIAGFLWGTQVISPNAYLSKYYQNKKEAKSLIRAIQEKRLFAVASHTKVD